VSAEVNKARTGVHSPPSHKAMAGNLRNLASTGVPAEVKKPAERLALYEGW